jgi:hypothetical protein
VIGEGAPLHPRWSQGEPASSEWLEVARRGILDARSDWRVHVASRTSSSGLTELSKHRNLDGAADVDDGGQVSAVRCCG